MNSGSENITGHYRDSPSSGLLFFGGASHPTEFPLRNPPLSASRRQGPESHSKRWVVTSSLASFSPTWRGRFVPWISHGKKTRGTLSCCFDSLFYFIYFLGGGFSMEPKKRKARNGNGFLIIELLFFPWLTRVSRGTCLCTGPRSDA